MPGNIFGGVDAEHDIVGRGHARLSRCGLQSCLIGGFAPSSASSSLTLPDTVVASGGVFQNQLLLSDLAVRLESESLTLWTNRAVPPNSRQ